MIRLAVSVEGQTEEEFVKRVLDEHLRQVRQASSRSDIGQGNRSRQHPCGVSAIRCVGEASGVAGR